MSETMGFDAYFEASSTPKTPYFVGNIRFCDAPFLMHGLAFDGREQNFLQFSLAKPF